MSLRVRLVLVAAAAVAAAVAMASVIVYFVVRDELYSPIDTSLQQTNVPFPRDALPPGPGGALITRRCRFIAAGPGGGPFPLPVRLIRANGCTYYENNNNSLALVALAVTAHERDVANGVARPFFFDATIAHTHARIYTAEVPGAPGYAFQVAGSIEAADHALSKIELWLVIVALGGTGVAAGAGFLVARSAMRPVRGLRDTAERVRLTQDLTQRIDVTGSDELGQLATTFNAMLAALDDAAQRQRQLVQDASHELRTPLTSLRTNIEVLASDHAMPAEDRKQLLADVVAQLTEMTALIGELTELARGEELQAPLEDVRLDLVTEEAIKRTARNHPDVPIDADLAPTTTIGAPATLERAIANLLDNAAKWSPAGARIDVRLAGGELVVRDHGPGISESDLPHIFERFYRATSARSMPGSGLGLAIVKQVAEAHGGTVVAERAPGGGTIMRFTIRNGSGAEKS